MHRHAEAADGVVVLGSRVALVALEAVAGMRGAEHEYDAAELAAYDLARRS